MLTDARPIMIGEAPSRTSDPSLPFSGRPMRWLAHHLDTDESQIRRVIRLENLLDRYPGPDFPGEEGRTAARHLLERLTSPLIRPSTIVLCGRNVARSFGIVEGHPFFLAESFDQLAYADAGRRVVPSFHVVPHPSGLSRWWNDPTNKTQGLDFFRHLLRFAERRTAA